MIFVLCLAAFYQNTLDVGDMKLLKDVRLYHFGDHQKLAQNTQGEINAIRGYEHCF